MAITLSVTFQQVDASGHMVYVVGSAAFSGSYTTGGDTLDLTQVASLVPSTQPQQVFLSTQNGSNNVYSPIKGSAQNNWKVKVFAGFGAELAAGAYPAGVTSDVVAFSGTYAKLQ